MSAKPRLAVIQFPGLNCEYETLKTAQYYGFDAKIVRWNESESTLNDADAFIVPGGFSFQDRVRAGAISAKLPLMAALSRADKAGKPIMGICNGCQILAESGLFPNLEGQDLIQVALAPNLQDGQPRGYVYDWVFVKVQKKSPTAFTRYLNEDEILPIPIAHGEGRFVLDSKVEAQLSELTAFVYTTETGKMESSFPTNPNGTAHNLAGLCNPKGNVLGLMPHPERAAFLRQIPFGIPGDWAKRKDQACKDKLSEQEGPWAKLFRSMLDEVTERIAVR